MFLIKQIPEIVTDRLILEPIEIRHAEALCELFSDPDLHQFVPQDPPFLEKQKERCERWEKRRSPDGKELWLNWAARDQITQKIIAHFQAGLKEDGVASIGYLVARAFQKQGLAAEGLIAIFKYLKDDLGAHEVRAWSDTRNIASHRLAEKVGMVRVDFIKDADFFKGAPSDEFVFAKTL
jgi:ribosomal-protein-alanine N-acetyltransferase